MEFQRNVALMYLHKTSMYIVYLYKNAKKILETQSKPSQNAHRESFGTSSNDRIPRIRTLRDRIKRGMTALTTKPKLSHNLLLGLVVTIAHKSQNFKRQFLKVDRYIGIRIIAQKTARGNSLEKWRCCCLLMLVVSPYFTRRVQVEFFFHVRGFSYEGTLCYERSQFYAV